jgi:gliding motility-associated protein GldC
MKHSEINFKIQLDDQNIPENITWSATDNPNEGIEETKAILVATWDPYHKGTLTLPLWTKDMEVLDMKRFFIEIMGTVSEASLQATGDQYFSQEIEQVCRTLSSHLQKEILPKTDNNKQLIVECHRFGLFTESINLGYNKINYETLFKILSHDCNNYFHNLS